MFCEIPELTAIFQERFYLSIIIEVNLLQYYHITKGGMAQ